MVKLPRSGFTMLELLMVVAIIAILTGMILAVVGPVRRSVMKGKTNAILAEVRLALATVAADGSQIAPVEHPLAGTALPAPGFPRPIFLRADGTPVNLTAEAIIVTDMTWVDVTFRPRVMLPNDRFRGVVTAGDLPLLYGMPRGRIGILGAADENITTYRRLPSLKVGYDKSPGVLKDPTSANYPDDAFLIKPTISPPDKLEDRSTKAVDYLLSFHRAGILQKGGIFTSGADGITLFNNRVWTAQPSANPTPGVKKKDYETFPNWQPGRVLDGSWIRYRLRGSAIYDAWGNEILCSMGANDAIRLESAGNDGVFRWFPGQDGVYQTNPTDLAASGDDLNGELDNVSAATRD
ncbi:MAG: type II secretion system protein [Planctomycetes bacterium]|nr:type II secretion system protein [Planctomycetota bacterium]